MRESELWVQPYLQNPAPRQMTVMWWTSSDQPDSFVEYGDELELRAAAGSRYVEAVGKWLHEVTLTGLEPETRYRYRVRSGSLTSAEYSLATAKRRDSDLSFYILGDGRTDDDAVIARHRGRIAAAADADLVFELGDDVFAGSTEHWAILMRRILTASDPADPGAGTASSVPVHHVVGNHEIAYPPDYEPTGDADWYNHPLEGVRRFKAFCSHPPNGSIEPDWEERYYVLEYGCATFIVLDANNTSDDELDNHDFLPDGSTPDWEPGSEQYDWMVRQLERARSRSAFTFVLSHPSAYTRGDHGTPSRDQDEQRGYELRALEPTFRRYGVDAVLSSHDHLYEHCLVGPPGAEGVPGADDPDNVDHIHHLVIGNSGNSSRGAAEGWEQWMSIHGNGEPPYYSRWFYTWEGNDELSSAVRLRIENHHDGTWTAAFALERSDGEVFDQFSIRRRDPLADEGEPASPVLKE